MIGRDAHLRHDLEQALVDRLDIALDRLVAVHFRREFVGHVGQRLEGEIGIDRFRAIAGQQGEMMHFARFAGLDDEPDRGAQALADQVMVHGGGGEQRRDRNAVGAGHAVGQHDDVVAAVDRLFGAVAQAADHELPSRARRVRRHR